MLITPIDTETQACMSKSTVAFSGKGYLYVENENFYWSISRALRQRPKGMESTAFVAYVKYQALKRNGYKDKLYTILLNFIVFH